MLSRFDGGVHCLLYSSSRVDGLGVSATHRWPRRRHRWRASDPPLGAPARRAPRVLYSVSRSERITPGSLARLDADDGADSPCCGYKHHGACLTPFDESSVTI